MKTNKRKTKQNKTKQNNKRAESAHTHTERRTISVIIIQPIFS